jgi:hypothetical protein
MSRIRMPCITFRDVMGPSDVRALTELPGCPRVSDAIPEYNEFYDSLLVLENGVGFPAAFEQFLLNAQKPGACRGLYNMIGW